MYEHAHRVLREVEATRTAVTSGRLRGKLSVSMSVTLGQALLAPRLATLLAKHPSLRVDVRLDDRMSDLIVDGVDIAVRAGGGVPDSAAVVAAPLFEFHRVVVAAPGALGRRTALRDPSALAQVEALVQIGARGAGERWTLVRGDEQRVLDVAGRVGASAPSVLREAALAGVGVALLPTWLVAADLAAGRLCEVLPGWRGPTVGTWALYRAELRGAPAVSAFVAAMRGAV